MAIAQHVHIPPHDAVTEEVRLRIVRRWFKGPHSGTWILVIENADNEADEGTNHSSIPNFIPQATSGTLIFTTRSRQVALQQFLATIDVGKMGTEEALVLFLKRYWGTGNLKDKEYEDVAVNLGLVHHLPLVIVGLVAYMTKTAISPSIYWNIF